VIGPGRGRGGAVVGVPRASGSGRGRGGMVVGVPRASGSGSLVHDMNMSSLNLLACYKVLRIHLCSHVT
jgi:hypothetical protein